MVHARTCRYVQAHNLVAPDVLVLHLHCSGWTAFQQTIFILVASLLHAQYALQEGLVHLFTASR